VDCEIPLCLASTAKASSHSEKSNELAAAGCAIDNPMRTSAFAVAECIDTSPFVLLAEIYRLESLPQNLSISK
jgi:hypothetical protein